VIRATTDIRETPPVWLEPFDPLCEAIAFDRDTPPLSSSDWQAFLSRRDATKLAALALRWVRAHDVATPEPVITYLQNAARFCAASTLLRTHRAAGVQAYLEAAGIASVVVKGPGVARFYQHPELRAFGDIDLMVAPADFVAALHLLRDRGLTYYEDPNIAARPFFVRHCWEGLNLVQEDGTAVDLHHHVGPWHFGRFITFDEVLRRSETIDATGARLRVADGPTNSAIVALHLLSSRPAGAHVLGWRDLQEVLRACDPIEVRGAWRAWRVDACISALLDAGPESLRDEFAETYRAAPMRPVARFRLRQLTSVRTATGAWERMFGLPAVRALAYAVGQCFPSDASLRARYGANARRRDLYRVAVLGAISDATRTPARQSASRTSGAGSAPASAV
jgi:hypothetical protein